MTACTKASSETFNPSELKKGFFPHLFNRAENHQYVGRIPDVEFYDPDSMKTEKKEELIEWHGMVGARNFGQRVQLDRWTNRQWKDTGSSMAV